MGADRDPGVDRTRIGWRVEPLRIDVVQPILQANLFRRRDLDGREVDLDVIGARRQADFAAARWCSVAPNRDVGQIDRRLRIRDGQRRRSNCASPLPVAAQTLPSDVTARLGTPDAICAVANPSAIENTS